MGGKKRPTISQLEKRIRREKKEAKEKKRKKLKREVTTSLSIESVSFDELVNEIMKMKYITPYVFSHKFGVKISHAKRYLKELEDRGVIKLIDRNRRIMLYVPIKKS